MSNKNKKKSPITAVLHLIQQAGDLLSMPRTHKKTLSTTYDTVASHSFHVAIIGYCLAKMEKLSDESAQRVVTMAIFHDLSESRTNDHDFIAKHYVDVNEELAVYDQFKNLPFDKNLISVLKEYEERGSVEAKVAKDADSLAQMFHEWYLMWQGNKLAQTWFLSDFKDRVPAFRTKSAVKIANAMKKSNPNEWWWSEFMDEDDIPKDLSKLIS